MKLLAAAIAILCLAPFVFAQSDSFEEPYSIEADGMLQAIVWKTRGGHKIMLDDNKGQARQSVSFNLSLYGNDLFWGRWLRSTHGTKPDVLQMAALRSVQGGGIIIPTVDSIMGAAKTGFKAEKITFGGGTTRLREPRGATVTGPIDGYELTRTTVTREMVTTARRQKLWMCSSFRISVGGVAVDSAISFEPIELRWTPTGDLDGDGAPDEALTGQSFAFEIPKANAALYQEMLAATQAGTPKQVPIQVDYLDEDGQPILTLSMLGWVIGVGPADEFSDPALPQNNCDVRMKLQPGQIVGVQKPAN